MVKRILAIILVSVCIFTLTACTAPNETLTATPTLTAEPLPLATPIPPMEIVTELPPGATIPSIDTIPHFPAGQDLNITFIDMIDANHGWAIGSLAGMSDHVLGTSDGGNTWVDLTPPEGEAASGDVKRAAGFYQDARNAWVIYSNASGSTPSQSVVWHTQDGGINWVPSQPLDLSDLTEFYNPSHLQLVDGQTGWLMVHVGVGMNHDYIVLYRSSDGGATWKRLVDPYTDTSSIMSCEKTGMLFTDEIHGWLTGDCHGVAAGVLLFSSSDGGVTWERVSLPEPVDVPGLYTDMLAACGSYDPFFFGSELGHLGVRCANYDKDPITYQYYLYTTHDGGNTWEPSTYPGVGLYFVKADTGWSLSRSIERTTDEGLTWILMSNVSWDIKVDFIDEQIGWGITTAEPDTALVKTIDGGKQWSMLSPQTGPSY